MVLRSLMGLRNEEVVRKERKTREGEFVFSRARQRWVRNVEGLGSGFRSLSNIHNFFLQID